MREKIQSLSYVLLGLALPAAAINKGLLFGVLGLGVVLGVACLNLNQIKTSLQKLKGSKMLLAIFGILLAIVLSVIFSVDFEYSVKKLIDVLIVLFTSFLGFLVLDNTSEEKFSLIFKSMVCGYVFSLVFLFLDMFVFSDAILVKVYGADNIHAGRVRYPSSRLSVIFPMVFGWIYYAWGRKNYAYALLVASFLIVFATGGRSAMCSLLAGTILMFVGTFYFIDKKVSFKKVSILLLSLVALFVAGLGAYRVFDVVSGEGNFEKRASMKAKDITAGRFVIWDFTFKKAIEKPIVGYGIGSFRKIAGAYEGHLNARNHPHNFVLEILFSTGIVGILAVLVWGIFTLFKMFCAIKVSKFAIFVISSYTAYWVNSLFSVSIIQTYWLMFLAITTLIGYMYIINAQKREG